MKYSIIQIQEELVDGRICGTWVQDHHGTLETATARAKAIEAVNGSRLIFPVAGSHYIKLAVTEQVVGGGPIYRYLKGLERLA